MLRRFPAYYHEFRCLAGSCPKSCCIGWEVEIDDDTAAAYAGIPGTLGEELRAHLTADAEGALCFPLEGARCPFLDGDDLCRIHRELGQELTSVTCREHPRFTEDFGPLQEISLSASCPEAARLLLAGREPLAFREEVLAGSNEESDPWLEPLLTVRDTAMSILRDTTRPIRQRMARILTLALSAQMLLDEEQIEEPDVLCREEIHVPEVTAPGVFPDFWDALSALEILEQDWLPLLDSARGSSHRLSDIALERLTEYFLFRWLLKAINDGDLLGRMQLSILSALTVERLAGRTATPEEALYRYCREIEHCEENIDSLLDAFRWDQRFSPERLLSELQNV